MYEVIGLHTGSVLFRGPFDHALRFASDYGFWQNLIPVINHTLKVIFFVEA